MNVVPAVLARPKSKILRVQSDLTTMLLGFRSCTKENIIKWITEQETRKSSLCVLSQPSVDVLFHTASGTGGSSSSRGPSPSVWLDRGSRPSAPWLSRHLGILLEIFEAWRRSKARWSVEQNNGVEIFETVTSVATYIFVVHQLHEFEFAIRSFGVGHILEGSA